MFWAGTRLDFAGEVMKSSLFIITLMLTLIDWCASEATPADFADNPGAIDATLSGLAGDSARADTGQSSTPSPDTISDSAVSGIDPLPETSRSRFLPMMNRPSLTLSLSLPCYRSLARDYSADSLERTARLRFQDYRLLVGTVRDEAKDAFRFFRITDSYGKYISWPYMQIPERWNQPVDPKHFQKP